MIYLLVLLAFGTDDEIDGDDEDEHGEEDAGDDGDPVDGAETAGEPLRPLAVDAGRLRRWPRRGRGRRRRHPELDAVGNASVVAAPVDGPHRCEVPPVESVEVDAEPHRFARRLRMGFRKNGFRQEERFPVQHRFVVRYAQFVGKCCTKKKSIRNQLDCIFSLFLMISIIINYFLSLFAVIYYHL